MILDYEPLSSTFQDASQAIKGSDLRLARIDISVPSFSAWRDLPPVELPFQCFPREVVALREETASSRLSLEAEIDQFRFEEEGEGLERLMEPSNSEAELDRFSTANSPRLVVARVNTSSEEKDKISLEPEERP